MNAIIRQHKELLGCNDNYLGSIPTIKGVLKAIVHMLLAHKVFVVIVDGESLGHDTKEKREQGWPFPIAFIINQGRT